MTGKITIGRVTAATYAGRAATRHRLPLATWSVHAHRRRTRTRFPAQITTRAGSAFRRWHIPTTFSPSAGAVCPQLPADVSECFRACGLPFHIYLRIWSARKHERRQPIRATIWVAAREDSFFLRVGGALIVCTLNRSQNLVLRPFDRLHIE